MKRINGPLGYRRNGSPIFAVRGGAPTLAELREERTSILAQYEKPDEIEDMEALNKRATEVANDIERLTALEESAKATRARLAGIGGTPTPTPGSSIPPVVGGETRTTDDDEDGEPKRETRTMGRIFVETAVKEFRANQFKGNAGVTIPGNVRALIETSDWPVQPTRLPGITTQTDKDRPLVFADMIDRQSLSTNSVEYVEETVLTNNAAEVTEGVTKAESTVEFELKTASAATIAHFLNVTRQAVEDDAQMQGYIEGRMTYGLRRRLDAQILAGNGTPPNLRGILNTSGIGTYTAGSAGEAALISIRKAITVAQISEYMPDTVGVNPIDWEAIELSTDTSGRWRLTPDAQSAAGPRVWGLAVVVTNTLTGTDFGVTGGTFLVGGFKEGATLWEHQGISLYLTDSHASNFTANILTLLAEMRAALTVWRPQAFVEGTFGASRT